MEEKEEITYLSLLQDVEELINNEAFSDDIFLVPIKYKIGELRDIVESPQWIIDETYPNEDIINSIDERILDIITDIGMLDRHFPERFPHGFEYTCKELLGKYFSKRFSSNFTDNCRRLNKFDKPFVEDRFEAIGRCANHIIDSYRGKDIPIDKLKEKIVRTLRKIYDKSAEKTISGYSKDMEKENYENLV